MEKSAKRQKLLEYLVDAGDDKIEALYTLLIKRVEEDDINDEIYDITDEQFLQLENERESYITARINPEN